jgi:hypothetical protein
MLAFRAICAGAVAWAVVWVLSQPQAAQLLREIPDMAVLAPIAGLYVGAFNLAVRQGWGMVVAFANGVWAGILSIVAAGVLCTSVAMARGVASGDIGGAGGFFDHFGNTVELLLAELADASLLTLALGASAAAGLLTELVHWLMVRVRSRRQRSH